MVSPCSHSLTPALRSIRLRPLEAAFKTRFKTLTPPLVTLSLTVGMPMAWRRRGSRQRKSLRPQLARRRSIRRRSAESSGSTCRTNKSIISKGGFGIPEPPFFLLSLYFFLRIPRHAKFLFANFCETVPRTDFAQRLCFLNSLAVAFIRAHANLMH